MAYPHHNASAASSSFARSAMASYPSYDVFINFRGTDVKITGVSHLYHILLSHGLRVFLNKSELQTGQILNSQIENAIRSASVHIAIFSPNYAESRWCLDELVLLLESRAPIIPVFYGVKPSELRWTGRSQDGSYANALRRHEDKQRVDIQTIQNWRKALSRVADISGFELEASNGDKGILLEKVVQIVLEKVTKPPLYVANYPSGLEEKVAEFESTVLSHQQEEHLEARVVGIVGSGGVGKTTLAKEFFNNNTSCYRASSFLFDVREKETTLNYLQSKLLKDLTHRDIEIEKAEEGVEILRKHLLYCHALIILDDVDHINQLDAFLPIKYVLDPQSLILVTSRDKHVLRNAGITKSSIYQLMGLDYRHSRELFCSYAFSQPHPLSGFEDLVDRFLTACYGLPLSLKVIGALLYGRNESDWEDEWASITQLTFPTEIHETLRILYDALDEEEKQMLLDIACFFIGKDRDMAIRIWDGSGWNGLAGFRNLEMKCLVEVDSEAKIRMNDRIRDLATNIADSSKLMPCRLWQPIENLHDLHDLLEQSSSGSASVMPTFECVNNCLEFLFKEICRLPWYNCSSFLKYIQVIPTEVRGFRMAPRSTIGDTCEEGLLPLNKSSSDEVIGISKLQLLEAEGDFVESILTWVRSPNLLWLRWNECPCSSLPSWIPMHNLRVLEVASRDLERLWQRESQAPLQLRELNIDAPLLEFPKSIGQLKHLEKIVVDHRENEGTHLALLPEEFCFLQSLKYLELKRCYKLKILPDLFGKLANLQHIDLSMCKSLLRLPDSFGYLANLQHINMSMCESLKMLPDSFGNLTNLQHINMSMCESLNLLPDSFGNLTNLQHINMSMCESLEMLPNSFGNLKNLQYVDFTFCKSLKSLPKSLGNLLQLKHLHLRGCCNLIISSRSLGSISTLECLDLEGCLQMEKLPPQVGHQQSLQRLNLLGTKLKELRTDVGRLSNLEVLRLGGPLLEMLPPSFGYLASLKELWLHECKRLLCLPDSVGLLTQLVELNILKCGIEYLPPAVMEMKNLEILRVHCCPLRELPFKKVEGERKTLLLTESRGKKASRELDNKGMIQLKELELYRTAISEVFFPEGVCSRLQHLTIMCCEDLVEVGVLPATLITLDIRCCSALKKIGGLYGLANLETLDMRGCNNIQVEELPGFETLKSLKVKGTPLQYSEEEKETAAFEEGVLREKEQLKIFCKGEEIL